MDLIAEYNYDTFVQEKFERWMHFDESPPLGRRGPDFELTTLDGETIHLAKLCNTAAYTIVEFGSLT
jgi:hypothetical protein